MKKISFLTFYFSEENYDLIDTPEVFEKRALDLTRMGFDGIELMVRDASKVNLAMMEQLAQQGVRYAALGTGKVYTVDGLSFSDPDPVVRKGAVQRIRDSIDLSTKIGAPPVILGSCRGASKDVDGKAMKRICDCLKECSEYAEKRDIRLALEPMTSYELPYICCVDEAMEVLDQIQSSHLGLTLDTCNMNIEEDSLERAVMKSAGRIFHVQIADNNRRYPSSGHIPFQSFLAVLYATGYDGYISAELSRYEEPLEDARRTLEYLRTVTHAL
ncbi:sugar phosphate isomerase/epimerase family protein [uncultured Ruthenibacterium sp.]|uniref:sugar phosphate isomerase/epimerase family protein n=1 Tax=uncultured Ruthenibacterium sp. TaxID=1905347 RepID=UPI00349E4F8E